MKQYLFNVQSTYAVIADSEDQAREMLDNDKAVLKDRDVLMSEAVTIEGEGK
jgi:hypothetical protein